MNVVDELLRNYHIGCVGVGEGGGGWRGGRIGLIKNRQYSPGHDVNDFYVGHEDV